MFDLAVKCIVCRSLCGVDVELQLVEREKEEHRWHRAPSTRARQHTRSMRRHTLPLQGPPPRPRQRARVKVNLNPGCPGCSQLMVGPQPPMW